jgi:hypothetical protein
LAGRQNRGAPPTFPREERMADRVDGFVLAMQPADRQPILDRARAETELAELGVRRDGVMIGGKRSDPMVDVVSPSHVKGALKWSLQQGELRRSIGRGFGSRFSAEQAVVGV